MKKMSDSYFGIGKSISVLPVMTASRFDQRNFILLKDGVTGNNRETLYARLGDEHPVKWVPMNCWNICNRMSMLTCDRQHFKRLLVQNLAEIRRNLQLTQCLFNSNFPNDDSTDENQVTPVGNRRPCSFG